MKLSLAAALCFLPAAGGLLHAQENVPAQGAQPRPEQTLPPSATPTEPGTASPRISPASQAPGPVQQPDVRLDSKPHTDIDTSVDSAPTSTMPEPVDLGLGADTNIDLGHDIVATTPPGMLSRSVPGNPRMVYFSLPLLAPEQIAPADAAVIAGRHEELLKAARAYGYRLEEPGWSYQQAVCPATEPDARAAVGVRDQDAGGVILLRFHRQEGERASAVTVVLPRENTLPVHAIPAGRNQSPKKGKPPSELLSKKIQGKAAAEALPPPTLYSNLQPEGGWIAASGCIAQLGGASPDIPNETFLSEDILTAPTPLLRLKVNGQREITFTDRVDEAHYVVWNEHVSRTGKLLGTAHKESTIVPRPVTNPPVPASRLIANIPQPPVRRMPPPPSPLSGSKQ